MTEAYPLHWPVGKPRFPRRQSSRFDVTFAKARDELFRELSLLGGRLPVLSTNIPLRRDGLPYANEPEPSDSGVAVYFTWKNRQMCFSCDRWDKVKDNIQAIRHTVSALRGLERWGTGDMVEAAFRGFEALPAPGKRNWNEILGVRPDAPLQDIEDAYKRRAKESHPDSEGGSHEAMIEVNHAMQQARRAKA